MNGAWMYTLIPAVAAIVGAAASTLSRPGRIVMSAIQHFAAGVVFATAAAEILPDVMRRHELAATMAGGAVGVAVMLLVRRLGSSSQGSGGLLTSVGVDVFIDGLVLGIGFASGAKAGLVLTLALTGEVLFLGLTVAGSMGFAEALADDGKLSGRGTPYLRGLVCGLMTIAGGSGHTLPYLISNFVTATIVAAIVVVVELLAIAWIQWRYMDASPFSAAAKVMLGGGLVLATGILIGAA